MLHAKTTKNIISPIRWRERESNNPKNFSLIDKKQEKAKQSSPPKEKTHTQTHKHEGNHQKKRRENNNAKTLILTAENKRTPNNPLQKTKKSKKQKRKRKTKNKKQKENNTQYWTWNDQMLKRSNRSYYHSNLVAPMDQHSWCPEQGWHGSSPLLSFPPACYADRKLPTLPQWDRNDTQVEDHEY